MSIVIINADFLPWTNTKVFALCWLYIFNLTFGMKSIVVSICYFSYLRHFVPNLKKRCLENFGKPRTRNLYEHVTREYNYLLTTLLPSGERKNTICIIMKNPEAVVVYWRKMSFIYERKKKTNLKFKFFNGTYFRGC